MSKSTAANNNDKEKDKKEEIFLGGLSFAHRECTKELEEYVVQVATNALKAYVKGEKLYYTDVAQKIKEEVEKHSPGTWHVIVGKSFGSHVTHEVKKISSFSAWLNRRMEPREEPLNFNSDRVREIVPRIHQ